MPLCKLKEHKYWEDKYKEQSEVIIDDRISELPSQAFEGDKDLRFISLPDSVTKICFRAFKDCTALEKIIIPSTVTSIGNNAFENCEKLKAVELAQGLTEIYSGVFINCKSLEYIRIPEGVTRIGSNAFCYCLSLRKVYLPDSLEEIEDFAFSGCKNLRIVEGGASLRKIGDYAFSDCNSLSKFKISSSVEKISDTAFSDSGLRVPDSILVKLRDEYVSGNVVRIPEGVLSIMQGALSETEKLRCNEIILPDSLRNISYNAFFSEPFFIFEQISEAEQRLSRLPQKMNMPLNYFRQETQFDEKMAFMLADTVWKDYVTDEDFEYMLLHQNSRTAQEGACDRLSENCSYHLSNMLELTDNSPNQLEHLAAYAASYPKKIDLSLLKALKKRSSLNKAYNALEILDKYCFTILRECKDEIIDFCLEDFSPYIAERYFRDYSSLNPVISCVRYRDSDKYLPDYLVKCVLAAYMSQLPENIDKLEVYINDKIVVDNYDDLCIVSEADCIAAEFDTESFKRVIDSLPIYDYSFLPPICRYGSADILDRICCQIAETENHCYASPSVWLSVAKKSLALSDNDEASAFLEGIRYAESNGDESDYEFYDEEFDNEDEFYDEEFDEGDGAFVCSPGVYVSYDDGFDEEKYDDEFGDDDEFYDDEFDDESEDDEFDDDEFEDDDGVVVACSSYAYGFCDEGLDEEQLEEAFRVDDYDDEFFYEDDDEYLL